MRARNPAAVYACDPVIGDEGRGVYVRDGVPEFFRDRGVPAATIVTPNAFELALADRRAPVRPAAPRSPRCRRCARRGPAVALATSLRLEDTPADALDLSSSTGEGAWRVRTPKLPIAVNGAGDLLSALYLHEWLAARDAAGALAMRRRARLRRRRRDRGGRRARVGAGGAQDALVDPPLRFAPEKL